MSVMFFWLILFALAGLGLMIGFWLLYFAGALVIILLSGVYYMFKAIYDWIRITILRHRMNKVTKVIIHIVEEQVAKSKAKKISKTKK